MRQEMRTLRTFDRIGMAYFYYDTIGKESLVKKVEFSFKPFRNTETSVTTHLYDYNEKGMIKTETLIKDNVELCIRKFEYNFY